MKGVSTHSLVARQQFGDSVPLVQGISNDYRDPGSHTACSRVRSFGVWQLAAAFSPASSLAGFSRRRSARPLRHTERSFGVRAACCRFFASQLAGWHSCLPGRNANTDRGGGGDSRKTACGKKLPQASLRKGKRQQAAALKASLRGE